MFDYKWSLKNANFTKDKGKVFSCFSCGGGSTMGYKLAGFDVIGCNEVDPEMMEIYKANHNPKYSYLEPIQEFKFRKDLPGELYNLDILDGSPPCSSFSIAGNREKDWGKEKKFREGQSKQVLDTLFFDFIDLAEELQPKVVVAENVKGLLQGKAVKYVDKIYKAFDKAGYVVQHWLLDSSKMGVPQKRERVFFIGLRKDLCKTFMVQKDLFLVVPWLELDFNERPILFREIYEKNGIGLREIQNCHSKYWDARKVGDLSISDARERGGEKRGLFNCSYAYNNKVLGTVSAHKDNASFVLFNERRYLTLSEWIKAGSFPADYNFNGKNEGYIIGMSVPPVMAAQIATKIYKQWLSKI